MTSAPTIKPFRPILACDADMAHIDKIIRRDGYVLVSYKLDGIRAMTIKGSLLSRSMKPIPNEYVRGTLSNPEFEGLDGELISGAPMGEGVFARASSAFMSHGGMPAFTYHVFDMPSVAGEYRYRLNMLKDWGHQNEDPHIFVVDQVPVDNVPELETIEEQAVALGYEGLIVRSPLAPYKQGRSTLRESFMLKLKRFNDSEAVIEGFEELMHNANEARVDERGFTKRSSEKAGKVPAGTLGALQVRDIHHGWTFNIGSGFDHDLRRRIWEARDHFRGQVVKYKYLKIGMLDAPRHPIFLGWRSTEDL